VPFKLWIVWTAACRYRQDAPSGTDSSITGMGHTSTEFVAFLGEVVASQPEDQQIHIILDNLSAHKTPLVSEFLEEHKNVKLHFTPTYSCWLNQVEIWFSRLERDVITRGIFTSVSDLRRKIMRYIRLYGKTAKPVRWKYADPTRRIKSW
jgi:transposase